MTARFTIDAPLACADTWAGRAIAPRMPSDRLAARAAPLHKGQATGSGQLAINDQLCGSAAAAREAPIAVQDAEPATGANEGQGGAIGRTAGANPATAAGPTPIREATEDSVKRDVAKFHEKIAAAREAKRDVIPSDNQIRAEIETDELEAIWHANKARRDQDARDYGEPETPHEYYAGRPGSKAERIVLDCLRELRAIPEADNLYAKQLIDAISAVYLDLVWEPPWQRDHVKIRRRTMALMRIAAGEKE